MKKKGCMVVVSVLVLILLVSCFGNEARAKTYANTGSRDALNGNYESALENYNKAIELNPTYAEAYFFRGNVYAVIENFEKAIEDCTEAIKLDPKLANAYSIRGICYIKLGKDIEAIADLEEALRLNPNDESVKQNLETARFLYDLSH